MAVSARLRVLGLTRYIRTGPSSRYRFYQFAEPLARAGIDLEICPLLEDWYLEYLSGTSPFRPASIVVDYLKRVGVLLTAKKYDLIWVEKEMLPWIPFAAESLLWGRTPIVVDLDDNHFQRYEEHPSPLLRRLVSSKMGRIVSAAAGVSCGSAYLADLARKKGARRIGYIPTVVDLARYPGAPPADRRPEFVVGWIGTPANARYLDKLRGPLAALAAEGPLRIVLVGAPHDALADLPVDIRPWNEADEIADLAHIDVGIMPLPDAPFERGKCGLKLIQYMAAWKPTIASPVGANPTIVAHGESGFLADTPDEWLTALRTLRDDGTLRRQMGDRGRARVAAKFDIPAVIDQLADFLSVSAQAVAADRPKRRPTGASLSAGPRRQSLSN